MLPPPPFPGTGAVAPSFASARSFADSLSTTFFSGLVLVLFGVGLDGMVVNLVTKWLGTVSYREDGMRARGDLRSCVRGGLFGREEAMGDEGVDGGEDGGSVVETTSTPWVGMLMGVDVRDLVRRFDRDSVMFSDDLVDAEPNPSPGYRLVRGVASLWRGRQRRDSQRADVFATVGRVLRLCRAGCRSMLVPPRPDNQREWLRLEVTMCQVCAGSVVTADEKGVELNGRRWPMAFKMLISIRGCVMLTLLLRIL
jgi:hypothetical protein